ncbi:MAG: periplasmic heavy metal sensor [Hyphomonas sp.]
MSALPKWVMPAALGVSLLVNLALGGYVAGAMLRGDKPGPGAGNDRPRFERPADMPELSREDRREVRQLMRQGFEAAGDELAARQEAERRFAEVLKAEPFDLAAAEDALQGLRDADVRLRDRIGEDVLGGLDELNADQRAWVAWILSDRRDGPRGRRGESGRRPEGKPGD